MNVILKNISINFLNENFTGLKFESSHEGLWKSRKDLYSQLKMLSEQKTEYNKLKYKNLSKIETIDDIHIKLSYSYLCTFLSFSFIFIGMFLILERIEITIIFLIMLTSIILMFLRRLNINIARGINYQKDMKLTFVELLFMNEEEIASLDIEIVE